MSTNLAQTIAQRLKQARAELSLSIGEAARLMEFDSYQTLSSIESGKRSVKAAELAQFARVYGRGLDFFYGTNACSEAAVRWRDASAGPAKVRAERRFVQFCEDYARLEELSGVRPGSLPPVCATRPAGFSEAERLADTTRLAMKLGSQPAPALRTVLEGQYGVKILVEDTAGAGSAACSKGGFGTGILINAGDAPWRRTFDMAHEIYHLLTWDAAPDEAVQSETEPVDEKLANCFASVLLLPAESVREEYDRRAHDGALGYADVIAMARGFGVSTGAMLWRLRNLKLASKSSVETALRDEGLKMADRAERRNDSHQWQTRPSERFVSLAFECLQNGTLSRGRFAELMGIRRGEVGQFLADYGFDEAGDLSGQVSTA